MADGNLERLDGIAHGLATATRGTLTWSWDVGMSAALATFTAEQAAAVLAAVRGLLPTTFDATTVAAAPAGVAELLGALGGLRQGQLLLCSAPVAAGFVFGAWWPWGNGKTISLRIGVSGSEPSGVDRATLNARLRAAMGL